MPNRDNSMFAEERKKSIVDYVNRNIKATVEELCDLFSVSPATIRNDLRELEEKKYVKRTHGGVISVKSGNYELNSNEKAVECIAEKERIAQAAVSHVSEGDIIAIDSGTTTYEFAKRLVTFRNLTVVTNDLHISEYLERNSKAEIILAGGKVRRGYNCTTGQKAAVTLAGLNVDKAFIGGNGISMRKGLTTPNMDMAVVKEALIHIADEIYFLADSTKIEHTAFISFAGISQVDCFITDKGADRKFLKELEAVEVKVELV